MFAPMRSRYRGVFRRRRFHVRIERCARGAWRRGARADDDFADDARRGSRVGDRDGAADWRASPDRRVQRTRDSRLRGRIRSTDATCASTTCSRCARRRRAELGIDEIVDGLNLDDLHDYRPGMQAASEKRVRHPLVEAEMTKADDARAVARDGVADLGSSRVAVPVVALSVRHRDHARRARRKSRRGRSCFIRWALRSRACGTMARSRGWSSSRARSRASSSRRTRETIEREFKKIGFRFVAIDLKGFRSGSLNEGLIANAPKPAGTLSSSRTQV